jgi:hypothetical protein
MRLRYLSERLAFLLAEGFYVFRLSPRPVRFAGTRDFRIRHVVRVPEKRPAVNEEAEKYRLQRISPEANGQDITP